MENKFRNETEITLAGEKILLRPTFENVAALETNLGAIVYLGWKVSRSQRLIREAKAKGQSASIESTTKAMLPMTDIAMIIYHCQAATDIDDPTRKKFSLDQIWDLVQQEGMAVMTPITVFIGKMVAGGKAEEEISEAEKKS